MALVQRQVGWALVILALALCVQVLLRPALPIDETRYLAVAWEMRLSGDPFHLTRNFESYAHKPPLLFWLINLVWLVSGVTENGARLVGPACAVGVAAMTAWIARRIWPDDPDLPLRAVLVMTGSTVFLLLGGALMFDALLTLPVIAGMGLLWRLGQRPVTIGFWALFGAVLALGVYAKGPVVMVYLLPPLVLIRLWAPQPPTVGQVVRGLAVAVAVALAMVSVWLVPALLTGDAAFRHELLWTQTAGRVGGGFAHDRPVWFLVALLPVLLFPFGWIPGLWPRIWRDVAGDAGARFCAVWALAPLVLFSLISGKQLHYLLPAFPAVALLFARALCGERPTGYPLAWLPLAALAGGAFALVWGAVPAKGDVSLALSPMWVMVAFGLACLGLIAAVLWWRGVAGQVVGGAGLALALHGVVAGTALYPAYDANTVVRQIGILPNQDVAIVGMPYNSEFGFAERETVADTLPGDAVLQWAKAHPDGIVIGPVSVMQTLADITRATIRYNGRDLGVLDAAAIISRESGRAG